MITLTTEEAIKELSRYTDQEFYTPQNRAAHQMAIEALERGRWIPVGERLPTEQDADETGSILAIHKQEGYVQRWQWDIIVRYPTEFTCWMPLPEPTRKDGYTNDLVL